MNKRVKSNSIRIISGQWRGRKLEVLDAEGLRPTTDRVRETLFNWLMYDVQAARCLDLFAGSGALGLECLSRGAAFVQFVELYPLAARSIQNTLSVLEVGLDQASVISTGYEHFLSAKPSQPFDIVFLDPPFSKQFLPKVVEGLSQSGWLTDNALIYIEQPSTQPQLDVPEHWYLFRQGKTGQSRFCLYSLSER